MIAYGHIFLLQSALVNIMSLFYGEFSAFIAGVTNLRHSEKVR
jgi:hypothetical protein